MTVTKQQQLEWLAKEFAVWPGFLGIPIKMSHDGVGLSELAINEHHEITEQEWQQERDKMQKQQDNSWHERGELPSVGCECEVKTKTFNGWMKCFVVGKSYRGDTVIECDDCAFIIDSSYEFRPLRTEREKAIESMSRIMHQHDSVINDITLGALYDAGYRKEQAK